jgi:hypothetical protein
MLQHGSASCVRCKQTYKDRHRGWWNKTAIFYLSVSKLEGFNQAMVAQDVIVQLCRWKVAQDVEHHPEDMSRSRLREAEDVR